MNLKDSYFHGGSDTHGLVKNLSLNGNTLTINYADKDATHVDIPLTTVVPDLSNYAKLLKPISDTTTASASTWSIPSGSKQVWGEKFSDSTLKYTPSGGSETTITDAGDLVMFLTPSATANTCTLNIKIDGTFYGALSGNATSATQVIVNQNNSSNNTYPLVWTNQVNDQTKTANQLYKSYLNLYYNPSTKLLYNSGLIKGNQLESTVASGTAPLVVASNTKVNNLNADLLDGKQGDDYLLKSGGTMTGQLIVSGNSVNTPLVVKGGLSNYRHNIQLIPSNNWSGILFGANDVTAEVSNITANSYWVGNNNGKFSITKNGSGNASVSLYCDGTDWYANTNKIAHAGNVSNKSATIGTSDTVVATIAGVDIKAKIASYLPTAGGNMNGNINFTQQGSETYTLASIFAKSNDGFIIETPRKTNAANGEILPLFVRTRGGNPAPVNAGSFIKNGGTSSQVLMADGSVTTLQTSIASTNTDAQVPTAKAVYTAINNLLATSDALVYKGTLAGNANNTNGGTLTPAASKGWVYKVTQSGYINGTAVEVGDMLICNTDSTPAATTSGDNIYSTVNAKWDFIQANLDPNQYVTVSGIQSITGEKTFTKANIGQLYVTGLAQFTNVISGSINGNAATADKLKNARTLKVNLATTTAQSFDGSANAEAIGVTGTLPTANGGTGNANGTIPYTKLTGSTTTANQAIVSNGTVNGWTLKTLGSNAFNSTAYLPLTGGTLSNTNNNILTVNNTTTNASGSAIRFSLNDTIYGFVGVTNNRVLLGRSGSNRIGIDTDGTPVYSSDGTTFYTLAHSNNSTQSAVTLTWGTNSNALKIAGTQFNVVLPSNPNTDRYVNSAAFAMDNDNGIKMTLTRAGSDTSTVTATISQIASTTGRGLTPKLALASTDTIATQASEYVLTYKSGTETTPVWRKLPANAWNNTTNPTWTSNAGDANYPIGFCTTASPTSGSRYNDYYNTIFTFNPSTKSLKIDGCTQQYDSTNKCLKFIFAA